MRLIDADAYKKYLDENWIVANYDAIDAQPTIDAVPVVRCKDCINFTQGKDEWGSCFENPLKLWRDTDYCSWGERKEDEDPSHPCADDVMMGESNYVKADIAITEEVAKKIMEESDNACSNCQEFNCHECEYRHWRGRR